jgi:hypothetical protein
VTWARACSGRGDPGWYVDLHLTQTIHTLHAHAAHAARDAHGVPAFIQSPPSQPSQEEKKEHCATLDHANSVLYDQHPLPLPAHADNLLTRKSVHCNLFFQGLACLQVICITASVCATDPANRPWCDLLEWAEDFWSSVAVLRHLGFTVPPPPRDVK